MWRTSNACYTTKYLFVDECLTGAKIYFHTSLCVAFRFSVSLYIYVFYVFMYLCILEPTCLRSYLGIFNFPNNLPCVWSRGLLKIWNCRKFWLKVLMLNNAEAIKSLLCVYVNKRHFFKDENISMKHYSFLLISSSKKPFS